MYVNATFSIHPSPTLSRCSEVDECTACNRVKKIRKRKTASVLNWKLREEYVPLGLFQRRNERTSVNCLFFQLASNGSQQMPLLCLLYFGAPTRFANACEYYFPAPVTFSTSPEFFLLFSCQYTHFKPLRNVEANL